MCVGSRTYNNIAALPCSTRVNLEEEVLWVFIDDYYLKDLTPFTRVVFVTEKKIEVVTGLPVKCSCLMYQGANNGRDGYHRELEYVCVGWYGNIHQERFEMDLHILS